MAKPSKNTTAEAAGGSTGGFTGGSTGAVGSGNNWSISSTPNELHYIAMIQSLLHIIHVATGQWIKIKIIKY